jgi:hypothetical protein
MKRIALAVLCASFLAFSTTGCYTLNHTVGAGAQGNRTTESRQWYVLWGLVPINKVDGGQMAGGTKNYNIKSQMSVLDVIINCVAGFVSVQTQTVTVTK